MLSYIESLQPPDINRVILHESAHAAMALVLGKKFEYVSVIPSGEFAGAVYNIVQNDPFHDAIVSAAGYCAETLRYGSYDGNTARQDLEDITNKVSKYCPAYDLTQGCNDVRLQAIELLKKNWKLVELVESGLKERKKLSYNEILKLCHL